MPGKKTRREGLLQSARYGCSRRRKGDPIAEAVAFLHDTVEDTSVTIEDIRTGFPKEVADAVSTLTHSKGISYAEYLWYIQQNSIAVKVKLSTCAAIWT